MAVLAMAAAPADARPLHVGLAADVGVPDGGTASLSVAPLRALRLHAGVSNNLVSTGLRAGLTWLPLATWATPSLSLDYGRYPEGDANPLARTTTGDEMLASPALERLGYDYANAHIGVELGRKWCTFYLHAGASRITSVVHGLDAELQDAAGDPGAQSTVSFTTDPTVTVWTVSARAGFIFYLTH